MVSSSPTGSARTGGSRPITPDHAHKKYPGRMMNLMFDPRVVRGPTLPNHRRKLEQSLHEPTMAKKVNKGNSKPLKSAPKIPSEPISTRKHLDIQTDAYLEEFVTKLSEYDAITQTDPFLDRPPTPLFIPQKSGPDIGTQIEEGDLFNFDEEVEPILEVLVGRTLEQSIMEVMEEKQIANLHAYQEHFEQIRAAELVATQRMEAAERRVIEEKKKRIQEEKKRLEEEKKAREKAKVEMYVRGYLKNMTDSIFRTLQKLNYFYDPVQREVEEIYLPAFMTDVHKELKAIEIANRTVKHMIEQAIISQEEQTKWRVSKVVNSIVSQVHRSTEQTASNVRGVVDSVIERIQPENNLIEA